MSCWNKRNLEQTRETPQDIASPGQEIVYRVALADVDQEKS
jgi:hypothetical protein